MHNFKKSLKIFLIIIFALFFFIGSISSVLANADNLNFGGQQDEIEQELGLGSEDPRIIIARVIRVFIGFLGIIAVGLIMYGGWLYMNSQGNEEEITKAKNVIQNAVIGLIIILASFAIVTFILNRLYDSTMGGNPNNSNVTNDNGVGILGSCSVESVYPEPYQDDIPRNTSIIITFKDEIDSRTICDSTFQRNGKSYCCDGDAVANGRCTNIAQIKQIITPANDTYLNARIYIGDQEDRCDFDNMEACVGATVYSRDNKTFVFVPDTYLGSPTETIWYKTHITNDVRNHEGEGVFDDCSNDYFEWQYEISTRLDLTPPQVLEVVDSGVFPPPGDGSNPIPKNAVIKINFNEGINPYTVSGEVSEASHNLNDFIKVTCDNCDGHDYTYECGLGSDRLCIAGNFEIANQYRTVEFISANKCGTNNCGEDIFCLPDGKLISVYLNAASLAVTCNIDGDCVTRNPYENCGGGICQDQNGINYPMGLLDGVIDLAMNSLDGNRNSNAEGNGATYIENTPNADGDNYNWFFWTDDIMDQTPPEINTVNQEQGVTQDIIVNPDNVNFSNPMLVNFSELMMSSSLRTGSRVILGNEHKGMNLYVLDENADIDTGVSMAHWVRTEDFGTYPNGHTQGQILHEVFFDETDYRGSVGSRAKDLFQNCYMPCVGPGCIDTIGSCCNGATTTESTCINN